MSADHQTGNQDLCKEYEEISNTALSSPNNTEELVKLKAVSYTHLTLPTIYSV